MPVVIERQEETLPPLITKDGVTVFRNLAFDNSAQQVLMESARDASVRTAAEAGDGTTTATILAEALVRNTLAYCEKNPRVSPQKVVRALETAFRERLRPAIMEATVKVGLGDKVGITNLTNVARISANGDTQMAEAVIKCFLLTGDKGNVTILEASGQSGYEVERIKGYPITIGYEDSCGKFYQSFINDPARQMCTLSSPTYVLFHGRLNDIYSALPVFQKIDEAAQAGELSPNVVLVATGFSEVVLAHLATNFTHTGTINVFPLQAPLTAMKTGQHDFLMDLAALSGAKVFDPINAPLDNAELSDLGVTSSFESGRFRSTVIGYRNEDLVLERADELTKLLNSGLSDYDKILVQERIGKVTGGIARLKIIGASSGELREKRDRAEDAICAVRGAIEHGALPGGGWMLARLAQTLAKDGDAMLREVLAESLYEPVYRLLLNAGYEAAEVDSVSEKLGQTQDVFDVSEGVWVEPFAGGILDSVPAVMQAIQNSISIAALLGTCGGIVVFKRDVAVDRQEARDTAEFLRNANVNPADERG